MKHDDPIPPGAHRALFDDAVANLDQATANRLRLMRRETLAKRAAPRARGWVPVAAFAMAALALGLGWRLGAPGASSDAAAVLRDAPSVPAEIPADLPSDDDAALYAWLGDAPVAADGEAL